MLRGVQVRPLLPAPKTGRATGPSGFCMNVSGGRNCPAQQRGRRRQGRLVPVGYSPPVTRTKVRRSLIHFVSTACVNAVKTPYSQVPSSFSNRIHMGFDLIFLFEPRRSKLCLARSKCEIFKALRQTVCCALHCAGFY